MTTIEDAASLKPSPPLTALLFVAPGKDSPGKKTSAMRLTLPFLIFVYMPLSKKSSTAKI